MKILIEEKDETQEYRPIPVGQYLSNVKDFTDRVEIYSPNCCGGETRVTVFKSEIPEGNVENRHEETAPCFLDGKLKKFIVRGTL